MGERGYTIRQQHGDDPANATIYYLEKEPARGGEGLSWRARRVSPSGGEDIVAAKVLSDYWLRTPGKHPPLSDGEMRKRFVTLLEQHRRVRRIRSPGIAVADEVFCADESWFQDFKDRTGLHVLKGPVRPVAVTGWIEGPPLPEWNRRNGGPVERVEVLGSVAHALDEAHASSEVLRDIKPENLVVDRRGRAVYVDFGLAMRIGKKGFADGRSGSEGYRDTNLTREIAPGRRPEPAPRSDRFSFAALVLHQLTGEQPTEDEPAARHARRWLGKLSYPSGLIDLISSSFTEPVARPTLTATQFCEEVLGHLHSMLDTSWVIPGATSSDDSDFERSVPTA